MSVSVLIFGRFNDVLSNLGFKLNCLILQPFGSFASEKYPTYIIGDPFNLI